MSGGATAPVPRTVALVPHPDRPAAHELARWIASRLCERGVDVRVPDDVAARVGLAPLGVGSERLLDGLDVAISIGGDGTMLRTVDLVSRAGVAVFGVNVGQLGYLTEVEPPEVEVAIERLLSGAFEIEERMLLALTVVSQGPAAGVWWALNEAVLEKAHPSRMVRVEVAINGRPFTTYAADGGVIVATPTGSTAYSFSARGPIVSPRHRCLLLTPVSPHMLFDRALVLDPGEELRFTISDARSVVLTVDGKELGELEPDDEVICTGGPQPARVLTFGPRDFHQILKAKFGLSDR